MSTSAMAARTGHILARHVRDYGEPAGVYRLPEASEGYSTDPGDDAAELLVGAHAIIAAYDADLIDGTTITQHDARLFIVTAGEWSPATTRDSVKVDGQRFQVIHHKAHRLAGRVLCWEVQGRL